MEIRKKRRRFILVCICIVLCMLAACSQAPQSQTSAESIFFSEPDSSYEEDGSFEESPDKEKEQNPPQITKGFFRKEVDKEDGLTLLAVLEGEVWTTKKERFVLNNIFSLPDKQMVISYSLFEERQADQEDPAEDIFVRRDYLANYDFATGTLGESLDITDEENSYSYLEQNGLLWRWKVGEQNTTATGYDGTLHPVREFTVPGDIWGKISPNRDHFYFISNGKLYRADTSQGIDKAEEVILNTPFAPQMLYDIFPNENGEDCGLLNGIAGDLKAYSAIANLNTGEMLYMNVEQEISYIENGVFAVNKGWTEEETSGSGVTAYASGHYEYSFQEHSSPYIKFLGDDRILFVSTDYETMENGYTAFDLWLYDGTAGTKLGSARLTSELGYAYITAAVPWPGEDAILLYLTAESGESLSVGAEFYRWEFGKGRRSLKDPIVTEQETTDGLLGDIIEAWDPAWFTPGECPQELDDLREKADQLEKRFGIELKISEECRRLYLGSYAVLSVSDRETVSRALSVLEYELSKYPEDFFRQFVWEEVQGIDMYLCGPLIGMDESVLDTGGGVTTIDGNRLALAVDCTEAETMGTTLHHEISHAIDRKLQYNYNQNLLDETKWDALNPFPDMYSYSYQGYLFRDYESEGLTDYIYAIGKAEETYFIDIYGLTYPSEDRAQIFALAMTDGNENIHQLYPHLWEKLNFFAQCIRTGFDTREWKNIRWEQ